MKHLINKLFLAAVFILTCSFHSYSQKATTQDIDWESFMSQQDMYWDRITANYYEGAIMGNGLLGTNFYKSGTNYRLDIGRVDVTEGRETLPDEVYTKVGGLFDAARLPIGYFQITPVGTATSETMRLSLYDAINKGSITTNKGTISFKSYTHADHDYIIFETETQGEESNFTWKWTALKATSPRVNSSGSKPDLTSYNANPNPAVKITTDGDYNLSIQNLFSGKTYVTAWKEVKNDNKRRLIVTVAFEETEAAAIAAAKQTIDDCLATSADNLETTHKSWWNNYYPASFVSFGNSQMESFYWAQMYKFACATRQDKMVVDLMGPWVKDNTWWPLIWMNLNIQATYSWQYAANRSELTEPLWKALNDNLQNLINNVKDPAWRVDAAAVARSCSYSFVSPINPDLANTSNQYEPGNLTWIMFHYWQYCIYNNKEDELKERFFPLLKRSIAYYSYIRTKDANGVYHLSKTASPEYPFSGGVGTDTNYDLSLLRWGLQTLLDVNGKYNLNDEKEAHWQDFLDNLVDYPVHATDGYQINATQRYAMAHRHYSHMMMIYPLYLVNWDQPENRDVITKTMTRWWAFTGDMRGYSYTGLAAMYASMGEGSKAEIELQKLLDDTKFMTANTLYNEDGNPVIETPFALAASLQDMYLQSWGDKIRVFHAVPTDWKKAAFIDLRTEGAFLVSASREAGQTVFIQVESEAGNVCRLQTGMNLSNIEVKTLSGNPVTYTSVDAESGLIEFSTSVGDVIQVTDKTLPVVYPSAVERPRSELNPYGVNDGPEVPVEGITLPAEATLSAEVPTIKLVPTFIPEDAKNKNVTWKSSNEEVVKVTNGQLAAISKGVATVTVTTEDGGFTASCEVTVDTDLQVYISTAVADSYVRGTYSANYGTEPIVVTKDDTGTNYDRWGYFKFSIADLDNVDMEKSTVNVQANLYVQSTGTVANTLNMLIYAVADTSWSETTINDTNKPAAGALLHSIPGFNVPTTDFNEANRISFDLTAYALAEYAKGNKLISLQVFQDRIGAGGAGTINFSSKENEDSRRYPTLSIQAFPMLNNLNPVDLDSPVAIYPNPTKDIVNVELSEIVPISIRNIGGVVLETIQPVSTGNQTIRLQDYPAGIYFLTIGNHTYKVVKQ